MNRFENAGCARSASAGASTDFRVARQVEAARLAAVIGDRDPAQLDVVFGRDDNLGAGLQASVDPPEHRPVEREGDFELVGVASDRLMRRGPHRTRVQVANEAEVAPFVGGHVLPPPRHRQVLPPAVAAAGIGHHDAIGAVREQVPARAEGVGRHVAADGRCDRAACHRHVLRLLDRRILQRYKPRDPFLEQQLGGLDARVGVEATLHRAAVEKVVEREQAHALVMRHVGEEDDPALHVGRHPFRRVVDRLVVAEASRQALEPQPLQVRDHLARRDRRREQRRVGGHYHVVGKAAFEAEAGHAKSLVLIVPLRVLDVVGRLGDAPWHAAAGGIRDLPAHHRLVGLVEQRARVRSHDQQRHQVLEHRRAPREQRPRRAARRQRASELEPVLVRHLAERDRHVAGEACFRREDVVVGVVETAVDDVVADREELALLVEEEAELDLFEQVVGEGGEAVGAFDEVPGMSACFFDERPEPAALPVRGQVFERQIARADDAGDRRHLERHDARQQAAHRRHPAGEAFELRVSSGDRRFRALEPESGLVPRGDVRRQSGAGACGGLVELVQQQRERGQPLADVGEDRAPVGERRRPLLQNGAQLVDLAVDMGA